MDKRYGKDKSKDKIGQRFGYLVVLRRIPAPPESRSRDANWECLCDCGNITQVRTRGLLRGTISCGCKGRQNLALGRIPKHGATGTPEYRTWTKMKQRCLNPAQDQYKYYGGRGITVCQQWQDSFEAFLLDVGYRPTEKHSLDRIDPDGNYEPGNVRWATKSEQSRNRRDRTQITFNGKTMLLVDWAIETGISIGTLYDRIYKHKWPIERALMTDPDLYHHK